MAKVNHAECALLVPHAYEGDVNSSHDKAKMWSIERAATYYELPPLFDRIGDWAICIDGLYCLTTSYPITANRFDESDWEDHMSDKTWIDMGDFSAALQRAKSLKELGYIG